MAIAAAAAAAAAAAQFNATVSTSEASSDRGTPPRGKYFFFCLISTIQFWKMNMDHLLKKPYVNEATLTEHNLY